jgi:hypothetical protein
MRDGWCGLCEVGHLKRIVAALSRRSKYTGRLCDAACSNRSPVPRGAFVDASIYMIEVHGNDYFRRLRADDRRDTTVI